MSALILPANVEYGNSIAGQDLLFHSHGGEGVMGPDNSESDLGELWHRFRPRARGKGGFQALSRPPQRPGRSSRKPGLMI